MARTKIQLQTVGEKETLQALKNVSKETSIINKTETKININSKGIQQAINDQKRLNSTLQDLQKTYDSLTDKSSSFAQKTLSDINVITKVLDDFVKKTNESNKVSKNVLKEVNYANVAKELNQIKNDQNTINRQKQEAANLQKELNKDAKEYGQLIKSLAQSKFLDSKSAKETAAQIKYIKDSLSILGDKFEENKEQVQEFNHAAQSAAYEVRHVFGKSLFKDATDAIDKLTSLEKKRAAALKQNNTSAVTYYDKEIAKVRELEKNLQLIATASDKKLTSNGVETEVSGAEEFKKRFDEIASYISGNLPESMQEAFNKGLQGFNDAWEADMTKFVSDAEEASNKVKEELASLQEDFDRKAQEKANTQQQTEEYKSLKADLEEIWNLENRIANLKKDPKKHTSEIQYTQSLLDKKKEELNYEQRIAKLSPQQVDNIKKAEKAQGELNKKIKSQGEDWKANNKKVSELGDTIKKVFNYVLVYRGFQILQNGIQKCIDTMKELDKAFTDIRLVTGGTQEETNQLAQDYNNLARELGSTTQEVAEGASEWLRQGKTTEETTELLRSSMTLSKVGAIESSQATELLTSSLNGYKLEAKDAMSVVDKISSIDLEAATSSYELATALSRTANSANNANVSFDKLLAMIGTTSSVTRKSAETIRRII